MRAGLAVALRTDAGPGVGYGHVMRSAALALALRRRGADVELVLDGDAWSARLLRELGLPATRAQRDLDDRSRLSRWADRHLSCRILVVDRPSLSPSYVASRRAAARAHVVACFIDGAGTPGPVDVAMTGSAFWRDSDRPPIAPGAAHCSGPAFLCLRPQVRRIRRRTAVPPTARRLVVTLGGGDPLGLTVRAVSAVALSLRRAEVRSCDVDVLIGPGFAARRAVAAAVESSTTRNARFVVADAPRDPTALLARADVAIAAGGSTLYELAYLGVPTISLPETGAESQNAQAMAKAGACRNIEPTTGWEGRLERALADLIRDHGRRSAMRAAGRKLIDGRGADRLARAIAEVARIT